MSGPATPYIGSTISLISNAGIRYEGTLFCIDTKESTVTLATVQSFGTENRPVEKQVAARPDVYEYIVFRGKDIKDLTVKKEPPKPQVQDPAIIKSAAVGSSPGLTPYSTPYQTPGVFSPFGGLPYSNYPVGYQPPQHFQQENRMPPMAPHMHGSIPQTSNLLPRNATPPIPGLGLSRNSTPSPDLLNQSEVKTQETQTKTTTQHATQTTKKKRKNSADKTFEKENKNPEQSISEKNEEKPRQDRKADTKSRGTNRRGRRAGYRGSRKESQPKEFEDDYDFESANANFKKEEIEEELQKKLGLVSLNDEVEVEGEENPAAHNPEPVRYYDKESSFFDSISCEAKDREKNKRSHPSWQEERKLNTETFGTSGFRRGRGGRGRGRGNFRGRGGGRGGYRGRGWRGGRGSRGSSRGGPQKDWVDYPLDADTSKLQQNLPSGTTVCINLY
ncbi:Protein LSM14-like A [Exaiptasia diaphana]|nr:Protein LSM14-like A [Exaiptasia diaphana]